MPWAVSTRAGSRPARRCRDLASPPLSRDRASTSPTVRTNRSAMTNLDGDDRRSRRTALARGAERTPGHDRPMARDMPTIGIKKDRCPGTPEIKHQDRCGAPPPHPPRSGTPRRASGRGPGPGALPGRGGRGLGDALGFEPALGVDGGLAAVAGGGDGLAIAMVVDVAGDEDALDLRAGLVVDDQIALLVDVEPVAEGLGVDEKGYPSSATSPPRRSRASSSPATFTTTATARPSPPPATAARPPSTPSAGSKPRASPRPRPPRLGRAAGPGPWAVARGFRAGAAVRAGDGEL